MDDVVDHSGEPGRPDPDTAYTPAEFVGALRGLQRWTGEGLRQLEKRAKAHGDVLPRSTVAAALARSTLPREDLVAALVSACGCDQDEVARWVGARRRIAAASTSNPTWSAIQPANPSIRFRTRPARTLSVVMAVLIVSALAVWTWGAVRSDDGAPPPAALPPPPVGRDQPCETGWICLYENADFNRHQEGRKLQFQEDYWQPLGGKFRFDDKASSWKNNLGRDACLSQQWPVGEATLRIPAGASSETMELGWDHEASGVKPGPC